MSANTDLSIKQYSGHLGFFDNQLDPAGTKLARRSIQIAGPVSA